MEIKHYPTLEHRIIAAYIDTFPEFYPSPEISEESQKALYDAIKEFYQKLYEDPSVFGKPHDDDAHPNRYNKSLYGKPNLITDMRKTERTITGFFGHVIQHNETGQKPSAKFKKLYEISGLSETSEKYPALKEALDYMTHFSGTGDELLGHTMRLTRCLFNKDHDYLSSVFGRLLGNESAFIRLRDWALSNGYVQGEYLYNHELPAWRCVKQGAGVMTSYEYSVTVPVVLTLVAKNHRTLINEYDKMNDGLKEFIFTFSKQCNACGYCTQRQKGNAKRFTVGVEFNGEKRGICPIFPEYTFVFAEINDKLIDGIIEYLKFNEQIIPPEEAKSDANSGLMHL